MSAQRKLENGWIAGSESKGRRADLCLKVRGGWADRHLRDYRQNMGSESKCRQVDRHLREYGRTGGSPSQRVRVDWWIAISESTGRLAERHLRE